MNDQISKLPVTWAYNLWHADTLPYTKAAREIGQLVRFPETRNGGFSLDSAKVPGQPGVIQRTLDSVKNFFK